MALTPKQEKFAQCVADGMSQADAYRSAFDVGATTKAETVQANASRLMADSMVRARVSDLKAALTEKALWTRQNSVQALISVLSNPESQKDVIAAVKELNAMHGFNAPQKLELSGKDGFGITVNFVKPSQDKI